MTAEPKKRLRAIFMGSPEFAVPSLRGLAANHDVLAVVTQPDRPSGRGQSVSASAVKRTAQELGLVVLQPQTVKGQKMRETLAAYRADVFVVVAFGQILPPKLLAMPRLGCINVHGSLLPRYRGAAPIQWAVLDGQTESGVTIMQMDAGVDTGPMFAQVAAPIFASDTAQDLHDRLAPLGAELLLRTLSDLSAGGANAIKQDDVAATYARMLSKEDGRVDFARASNLVSAWIRGMDPWPGAFTTLGQDVLKLFRATDQPAAKGQPAVVLAIESQGALVGTGTGAVWIRDMQLPGRRRMSASDLANGGALKVGDVLGEK